MITCRVVVLGYKKQRGSWSHHQTTTHQYSQLLHTQPNMSLVNNSCYRTSRGNTITRSPHVVPLTAGGAPYPSVNQVGWRVMGMMLSVLTLRPDCRIHRLEFHGVPSFLVGRVGLGRSTVPAVHYNSSPFGCHAGSRLPWGGTGAVPSHPERSGRP